MTAARAVSSAGPHFSQKNARNGALLQGFLWLLKYDQTVSFKPAGQLWFTPGTEDQLTAMPLLQPERVFEVSTG